jgi:uncharacterized membrane protein YdjX (TVP38/TMEM64 family)
LKFRFNNKTLIYTGITLFLFLFFYWLSRTIPEEKVEAIIESSGFLAPLVFIIINSITYIFPPLSGGPMLFIGFVAFRHDVVLYNFISSFISSIINFWIARKLGRNLVMRMIGIVKMERADRFTKEHGYKTLFILRVLQGGVGDYVSYATGLTSMRFKPYILITFIGLLPENFIFYYLSKKTENPVSFTALSYAIAGVLTVIFLLYEFIKNKLTNTNKGP